MIYQRLPFHLSITVVTVITVILTAQTVNRSLSTKVPKMQPNHFYTAADLAEAYEQGYDKGYDDGYDAGAYGEDGEYH